LLLPGRSYQQPPQRPEAQQRRPEETTEAQQAEQLRWRITAAAGGATGAGGLPHIQRNQQQKLDKQFFCSYKTTVPNQKNLSINFPCGLLSALLCGFCISIFILRVRAVRNFCKPKLTVLTMLRAKSSTTQVPFV